MRTNENSAIYFLDPDAHLGIVISELNINILLSATFLDSLSPEHLLGQTGLYGCKVILNIATDTRNAMPVILPILPRSGSISATIPPLEASDGIPGEELVHRGVQAAAVNETPLGTLENNIAKDSDVVFDQALIDGRHP